MNEGNLDNCKHYNREEFNLVLDGKTPPITVCMDCGHILGDRSMKGLFKWKHKGIYICRLCGAVVPKDRRDEHMNKCNFYLVRNKNGEVKK